MPSFSGEQGSGNGFQVAHFADENNVRILTQSGAEGGREIRGVYFHFALVNKAFLVAVQELDRVFDGDEMVGAIGVDAIDHGREGGGLTGTGGAGYQYQTALLLADAANHGREI